MIVVYKVVKSIKKEKLLILKRKKQGFQSNNIEMERKLKFKSKILSRSI